MARVFVGDRVQTPDGEGIVVRVETWRQRVVGMREADAREFSELCRAHVGDDFQRVWFRAMVKIRGVGRWHDCRAITVVESRAEK